MKRHTTLRPPDPIIRGAAVVIASSLCHHRPQRRRQEAVHQVMSSRVRNTRWAGLATILLLQAHTCVAFSSPSLKHSEERIRVRRTRITRMVMNTNGEQYSINHGDEPSSHIGLLPRHVAFICDGNSKWANARRVPASVGHLTGADRLMDTIQTLKRIGVQYATFYAFSTENWKRPPQEIEDILSMMTRTARKFYCKAMDDDSNSNIRIKILGDVHDERIPNGLREILLKLEQQCDACPNRQTATIMTVCFAINYGGRQDILNASLRLAEAISSGQVYGKNVTEEHFSSLLSTSDLPDPDSIIRTGGEKRLSNFFLWNSAYSELYFSNVLWPDVDETFVMEALEWFSTRSRQFGGRVLRLLRQCNMYYCTV